MPDHVMDLPYCLHHLIALLPFGVGIPRLTIVLIKVDHAETLIATNATRHPLRQIVTALNASAWLIYPQVVPVAGCCELAMRRKASTIAPIVFIQNLDAIQFCAFSFYSRALRLVPR